MMEETPHKSLCARNIFYKNRDILSYFINKSPNALTAKYIVRHKQDGPLNIPYIYKQIIFYAIENIDILYRFDFNGQYLDDLDYFWNTWIWRFLSNPHGGLDNCREVLLYGLVSGNISHLPTSFVKIYKLSVNDIKKYIDEGIVDKINYGNTHSDIRIDPKILEKRYVMLDRNRKSVLAHHMFPEDCLDNADTIIRISQINGYEDYTLERCERDKADILEFLKELHGVDYTKPDPVPKVVKVVKSDKKPKLLKLAGRPGTKRKAIKSLKNI